MPPKVKKFIIHSYQGDDKGNRTIGDMNILGVPLFMTKPEPITDDEIDFNKLDELIAKSYDISNLMAVNGEAFLKELEIEGDKVVKKMLYNSPTYVESSNILPEQKLFLTLFHTLHFAAFNVSELPTLSSSFAARFRAVQTALKSSKELATVLFGMKEVEFREYFNTKQALLITNPKKHIEFHKFLDMIMEGEHAIWAYFAAAKDASNTASSVNTALTGNTAGGFERLSLPSGSRAEEAPAPAPGPATPIAGPEIPPSASATPESLRNPTPFTPAHAASSTKSDPFTQRMSNNTRKYKKSILKSKTFNNKSNRTNSTIKHVGFS